MRRISWIAFLWLCTFSATGQTINEKLAIAFRAFESDPQLANGIASLYVTEAGPGTVLFERNATIGLAPASTQKIITTISAYELLGRDFRYKTAFGYTGQLNRGRLNGVLFIKPSGDPTLGSWRWEQTKEEAVIRRLVAALGRAGIQEYAGIAVDQSKWNHEAIPDGWIWQDIGNYYGSGAHGLNWRENQYDVFLKSSKNVGSPVEITGTKPSLYQYKLRSELQSAGKGTGDNAYIYFPLEGNNGIIRGTIPVEETRFTISGAMPSPQLQFAATLEDSLKRRKILNAAGEGGLHGSAKLIQDTRFTTVHTETSPPLDSIVYWFNKKSINLYGEALLRTIAFHKKQEGDAEEGVQLIKELWKEKGVPVTELNIVDGSGLSPLNRVTTKAQVTLIKYASNQPWYEGFYHALPEYNGMRMKSGTIRGVKGFCGYHQSKDGKRYVFSFIVNNYNGSASSLVQKMYKVLDVLK